MAMCSIVIPTHNSERYIRDSLSSAQSQTVRDIEIIVVDNASVDSTRHMVESVASQDPRIRFVRHERNMGPVLNWKAGLSYATSPYCKLLFSDDVISNDFVDCGLKYLQDDRCGMVISPAIIGGSPWCGRNEYSLFAQDSKILSPFFVRLSLQLMNALPVSPCAMMARTQDMRDSLYCNISGYESNDYMRTGAGVDWLMFPLIAMRYSFVQYLSSPLVFFRSHGLNLTWDPATFNCYERAREFMKGALGV
jgi:glycosyltransferase involved in cell wall biosynthesis